MKLIAAPKKLFSPGSSVNRWRAGFSAAHGSEAEASRGLKPAIQRLTAP